MILVFIGWMICFDWNGWCSCVILICIMCFCCCGFGKLLVCIVFWFSLFGWWGVLMKWCKFVGCWMLNGGLFLLVLVGLERYVW